jgi:hypothetical protein
MSASSENTAVRTVGEWLFGCVNFAVPGDAVTNITEDRGVDETAAKDSVETNTLRLMKADLYKWIILGPGRVTDTKDQDNGWAHAGGGYTLSKDDKKMLMDEANAIYEELEPSSVFGKKKIRMRSAGIMPAYRDTDGTPLPRKPL